MRCHAYPDALAEAQAAVACAPNEWRTHLQLASVDFAAKDVHERTRRAAQRAVELAPDESEAHFVLAQVHFAQKDYSAARAQFLETLRLDPDNGPARNNLAVIDIRRRKWISAIPHLIGALRLDPSSQVSAANLRTVLRFWVFLVAIVGGLGESIISGSIHDHVSSTSVVTSPHGRTAPLVGLAAALIGAFVVVAAILRITVGRRVVPILAASMRVDRLLGASIAIVVAEVGLMVVAVSVGLPAARGWVTASAVCAFVVLALRIGSIVRSRRKPATIRVPLRQVR
jgi:tetratricopeptide (TPR) repeat protein